MSMSYTYVTPHLPESKLRIYPTKVINIIGGPGCDKSLYSAAIVLKLHLRHKTVETVPDHAKGLVWQQDFEALRNQYGIALQHYRMLEVLDGQVQFLVTEGSLPQLLYYNETYPHNVCDVAKTREQILEWHKQFNNVNVLVQRDPEKKYVSSGRLQDEEEARRIDGELRGLLRREGIKFIELPPDFRAIVEFAAGLE
ncbi:AAA family ATPase [Hydrogenophaga aquatica]